MDIKDIAKQLGSLGGKKTAQTHDKEYYIEKAKHMNSIKAKKKILKQGIDKSGDV